MRSEAAPLTMSIDDRCRSINMTFLLLSSSIAALAQPPPPDIATAVYLTDYPAAKCLDGSPYAFYLRQAPSGGANATKWVFHLQGGGWCDDEDACVGRTSNYLGTSKTWLTNYTNTSDLSNVDCDNKGCGALMLNDPAINPLAHDWNAVFLRYCDGMSFASNRSAPYKVSPQSKAAGQTLWFRGLENLHGSFKHLTEHYSLGDATTVLLNGASAGGLATYIHADTMKDLVHSANTGAGQPPATVIALPDSGFWPDDVNERFSVMFRSWFALQDNVTDGLPKNCKWAQTNLTRCLFPQYWADEIETRLFPLQSLYDPLQAIMSKIDPNIHGDWLLDNINRTILSTKSAEGLPNGGFLYSCSRHCGGELLTIDGDTVPRAMAAFMAQHPAQVAWVDHKPFPCTSCCNDPKYPPSSPQSTKPVVEQ